MKKSHYYTLMKRVTTLIMMVMLSELITFAQDNKNFKIYFVDSIKISNPIVVHNKKSGHHFISSSHNLKHLNNKHLINNDSVSILELDAYWTIIQLLPLKEKIKFTTKVYQCKHYPEVIVECKNNYCIKKFEHEPDYYYLFLITGKGYNGCTYYSLFDGWYYQPLKFKDPAAYYRVLVPVWY